jgi:hypothetical protein
MSDRAVTGSGREIVSHQVVDPAERLQRLWEPSPVQSTGRLNTSDEF